MTPPKAITPKPTTTTVKATTAPTTTKATTEASAASAKTAKVKTPEQQARDLRAKARALRSLNDPKLEPRAVTLMEEADAIAPLKGKSKGEPRPTCTSLKADGTACTAKAMAGSDVCTDHRAPHLHLTDVELGALRQWMNGANVEEMVAFIGWGKVRQAIKTGEIPAIEAAA